MFDYWMTLQKRLHSKRMIEISEEIMELPPGTFKEPDTANTIVRYLNILHDMVEKTIKEDNDV